MRISFIRILGFSLLLGSATILSWKILKGNTQDTLKNENERHSRKIGERKFSERRNLRSGERTINQTSSNYNDLVAILDDSLTKEDRIRIGEFMRHGSLDQCISLLEKLPFDNYYRSLLSIVANRVASEEPTQAITWLMSLERVAANKPAFTVIGKILGADSKWLIGALEKLKNQSFREELLQHSFPQLAFESPDLALAILRQESLARGFAKAEMIESSIRRLPDDVALNFIYEISKDQELVTTLNDQYWGRAIILAAKKEQGNARKMLTENILDKRDRLAFSSDLMSQWAAEDPTEAALWVESIQEGKQRDQLLDGFVSEVGTHQPADALAWAALIKNTDLRRNNIKNLISRAGPETEILGDYISQLEIDHKERQTYLEFLQAIQK